MDERQEATTAPTPPQEPGYEVDWNRVLEILQERSKTDSELRLHIEAAMWQAIAERLRSKLTPPDKVA